VASQTKDRPMVIETAHARAVVLGTRLGVRAEATQTRVEVEEGLVQVESRSSGAAGRIAAGQTAVVQAQERNLTVLGDVLVVDDFENGLGVWKTSVVEKTGGIQPADEAIRRMVSIENMPRDGRTVKCLAMRVREAKQPVCVDHPQWIEVTNLFLTADLMIKDPTDGGLATAGAVADVNPDQTRRRTITPTRMPVNEWFTYQAEYRVTTAPDGRTTIATHSFLQGQPRDEVVSVFWPGQAIRVCLSADARGLNLFIDRIELRRLISVIPPPDAPR